MAFYGNSNHKNNEEHIILITTDRLYQYMLAAVLCLCLLFASIFYKISMTIRLTLIAASIIWDISRLSRGTFAI